MRRGKRTVKSDIEIALECEMKPIVRLAGELGIKEEELEPYGHYKAKLGQPLIDRLRDRPDGKLVLVTAINPTPAGEGKTTTTVGLGEAMQKLGKNCVIALREPSLGPVFGVKGGAAGGGYAQVVPMEDINLHFTGDMHAITAANNLICAAVDNHIQQGNPLGIDPRRITFKRAMDMNDRALRNIVVGLGGPLSGVPRQDGFLISVASEIMAILCLADDLKDLKERIGRILVGYTYEKEPVYVRDLEISGAVTCLLKDAINPNLVQTLEGSPAILHGGPFANIAHGCNSVRATRLALKLGDYCITEAGFGSDLGAEKFLDIKCRAAGLAPSAIVVVATVRALKYNGGVKKGDLALEDSGAVRAGLPNLQAHLENMRKYGVPVVAAINHFAGDFDSEVAEVARCLDEMGVPYALSDVFSQGGTGGVELAQLVCRACEEPGRFAPLYDAALPIEEKIGTIAREIYGAAGVEYTSAARQQIRQIEQLGRDDLPVCIAKTQYSLSDDPKKLGRPRGFTLQVKEVRLSSGAGFLVALAGDIMTMPGLPPRPAACQIDIDEDGRITGLF